MGGHQIGAVVAWARVVRCVIEKGNNVDTFEAIYGRRAVKHYDPGHEMPEADLKKLLEATMQSPTSFNIQHWRFVVIRDPELRKQIRAVGFDQAQMTDASVLIVMTADVDAWKKEPSRYWENAPAEVAEMLVNWMDRFTRVRCSSSAMRRCARLGWRCRH